MKFSSNKTGTSSQKEHQNKSIGTAYPTCSAIFQSSQSLSLSLFLRFSPPPYPPLLLSDQTSPVSSFPVADHLVGTPTLDQNGRAAAKPTIGARQRRICLSACSTLPAPCAAKTSHPASDTLISVVSMSQDDPVE